MPLATQGLKGPIVLLGETPELGPFRITLTDRLSFSSSLFVTLSSADPLPRFAPHRRGVPVGSSAADGGRVCRAGREDVVGRLERAGQRRLACQGCVSLARLPAFQGHRLADR